jgi:hypothetical protein
MKVLSPVRSAVYSHDFFMIGFNAKYHATGTSRAAMAMWTYPKTKAPMQYAIKNPKATYGSDPPYVKKDTGKGPKMTASTAMSIRKLSDICMTPPFLRRSITKKRTAQQPRNPVLNNCSALFGPAQIRGTVAAMKV